MEAFITPEQDNVFRIVFTFDEMEQIIKESTDSQQMITVVIKDIIEKGLQDYSYFT